MKEELYTESGPLAARRAMSREIAKMSKDRTRLDDAIRGLRLQARHVDELATELRSSNLDSAHKAVELALEHLEAARRLFFDV